MASRKPTSHDDTVIIYTHVNQKNEIKTHTGYWYPHDFAFRSAINNKKFGVPINSIVRLKAWK